MLIVPKLDISTIIVNFNTPDLLRQCLDSVLVARKSSPKLTVETIVVNVTPEDGSGDFLAKEYNWVKQIITKSNDGFAANNNKALPYVKGEYILYLNSDTTISPDSLSFIHSKLKADQQMGAATCRIDLVSGNIDPDCHRGFPTPWAAFTHFSGLAKLFPKSKLFGQYHLTFMDIKKEHEIDALAGAFMMISKKVAERTGYFDEDYFFYGEDIDFCYRIKQAGYKIMFYPQVSIVHHKGASSGIRGESANISKATQEIKIKMAIASTKAMEIFYKKHWMEEYPKWLTKLVFVGINILRTVRVLKFKLQSKKFK